MRVCDVTQFYSPVSGGVKRYLTEKRDFIAQHTTHEHVLIVPGPVNAVEQEGRLRIHYVRSPRVSFTSHYRIVLNTPRVHRLILQEKPDIIEAGEPYQLAWSCLRAGRELRCPVVAFYHSHFPESYLRTLNRYGGRPLASFARNVSEKYIRKLYPRFHHTLVASPKLRAILEELGVNNTRMMPLGVETDVFEPSVGNSELKRRLGLSDKQILLLFVGRLAREKKIDWLIEAFKMVRHYTGDKFALLIVGEGAERSRVEEAQKSVPHLHLLPYEGNARKLANIYASADLLVHASQYETFGLVVLEAQACGTPAIAFKGSGMDDLIFGGNDFLAAEKSPEALAKAILKAYQYNLKEVGARAREAVIEQYPWKLVFKRLFDLYESLLAKESKAESSRLSRQAVEPISADR
jgi:alpha-1,6-mannosyltransferase